jgi:hypothetical protein
MRAPTAGVSSPVDWAIQKISAVTGPSAATAKAITEQVTISVI